MMGTRLVSAMVLLASLITACTPQLASYRPALESQGEIYLYLQPIPQEAHRLEFSLIEICAIRDDGGRIQLAQSLHEIRGRELLGVQSRLASAVVPPGLYRGLSVRVGAASLVGGGETATLLASDEPLFIEQEFTIIRRRATALFLSLEPERSVTQSFQFTPIFSVAAAGRKLNSLLAFATNSRRNIVSVLNKDTMEVVDAIATSSGPKGVVLDQRKNWVYVALAGDDAIEIVEVSAGEIFGRIRLGLGDEPVELALSGDGRTLVSANYGSSSASIIDTESRREVGRVNLLSAPTSVVLDSSGSRAYALQPTSNAVSVIDLARRRLGVTQSLEEAPVRGAISQDGNRLYVITRNSPNLLVLDAAYLRLMERIFVGAGAVSIKVDSKTGLIYVGKKTGDIAVVDPSALTFVDTFRVGGSAAFLAIDDDQNDLLVALPDLRVVKKLDLISKKPLGTAQVEEGVYAIAVVGER
jgi:DNA-binding beta-propeller fold protein YncE